MSSQKSSKDDKSKKPSSDDEDEEEIAYDDPEEENGSEASSKQEEHKEYIIEEDVKGPEENEFEEEGEMEGEEEEKSIIKKVKRDSNDDTYDMEDIYDEKVYDANIYDKSGTGDEKPGTDEILQAGKLSGLFCDFFEKKEVFKPVTVTKQLVNSFANVDYSEISRTVASLGLAARLSLRDSLEESDVNVLDLLNKEENFDIRTIFMGLFSERSILHTLMIRNAIRKKDSNDLAKIIALKTAEMMGDIRKNYLEIYGSKLEDDLVDFPEGQFLVKAVTLKKYYAEVPESAWDAEATRVMGMLKVGNPDPFAIFTMCFSHVSFKGICCTFYNKFGYTFCDYLPQTGIPVSLCQVIKIMHDALLSPKSFYCNYLHDMIDSRQNTLYFPYMLVFLIGNGLNIIMKQYVELYGTLNASQVATIYEPGIRDLVAAILDAFRA